LGKIFDALEKFAKERGYARPNAIRQSDYEILMKFDYVSGKLKVDSAPGSLDQRRLQRMMTYRLVREDGTLTPAGRAKYEEIKRRHQHPVPPKSETSGRVEVHPPFEIPAGEFPELAASDWAVIMKYDRKTGNLLRYDPETGNLDQGSTAILKDPETIQRLIDSNMILPGGWLTPEAKRGCLSIEEKLKNTQFEDSAKKEKTAAARARAGSTPAADPLSQTEMQALMDYDHDTLKLNMRNPSILKDPQIINRLLKSGLIDTAGKLSAKALVRCRVLENWNAELEGKQAAPAVRKPSAGEKLPEAADKKQAADLQEKREKPDKRNRKVIHLKKETPEQKKADKQPVTEEDAPEPAAKEREKTAVPPKKTPVAKDSQRAARVKPAISDPQKPAGKSPIPEPVIKPPPIPAAKPEIRADKNPGQSKFVLGKAQQRFDRKALDKNLVSLLNPQSFEAEQFKILRTNLLFPASGQSPRSIMVTSAMPGEGKSFVAANLAVSVALHVNRSVLLIDCDLRRPSIHRQFGFGETPGLSDYLARGIELPSLLLKTGVDHLTILPAGRPPSNPSELLSSERMSDLIKEVSARYRDRLIIIDSPPPKLAAESGALARQVDGILVVIKYASTPRKVVTGLIDKLDPNKVLGAIVNNFEMMSPYYARKYYGHAVKPYGQE